MWHLNDITLNSDQTLEYEFLAGPSRANSRLCQKLAGTHYGEKGLTFR